jgi:hypothetical protein
MSVVSELTKRLFPNIREAGKENIERLIKNRFGDVVPTEEAAMGIRKNINDLNLDAATAKEDELFAGITGASEYKGNILTQAFNTNAGAFSTLGMGAAVGAIGATATGGDFREGAALGAAVGMGIAGAGKAIMKNIGSVEDNFMNSLLKNKTIKKPGEAITESLGDIAKRQEKTVDDLTFGDLQKAGYGDKQLGELFSTMPDNLKKSSINDAVEKVAGGKLVDTRVVKSGNFDLNATFSGAMREADEQVPAIQALTSRSEKINAISNLTPEEIKKAGFGAQYKQDVLMGRKDLNVAQATRMSGFIGTALTGMAFSSKRRDHRRGFNKRRGNRV